VARILFVRHGQASLGEDDYDRLSATGLLQAGLLGRHIGASYSRIDLALVGPRRRHRQTFDGMLAAGLECRLAEAEPAVDEYADGTAVMQSAQRRTAVRGQPWPAGGAARAALFVEEVRLWAAGEAILCGDVPTAREYCRGAGRWLAGLCERIDGQEQVLVATSAGFIAAAFCNVLGLPLEQLFDVMASIYNGSITTLSVQHGRPRLRTFNEIGHFPRESWTKL